MSCVAWTLLVFGTLIITKIDVHYITWESSHLHSHTTLNTALTGVTRMPLELSNKQITAIILD